MAPANEGLVAGSVPIAVLLRLIIQIELPALHGEPQIMLERAALAELLVHRAREQPDRAPALVLGPIERRIRVREQRNDVIRISGKQRRADAEIQLERMTSTSIGSSNAARILVASSSAFADKGTWSVIPMNSSPPIRAT
jgi:hypothetical protein